MKNALLFRSWLPIVAVCSVLPGLQAGEVQKASNSNDLNLATSWTGGVVPGENDVMVIDSTLTLTRSALLGDDLSWAGIKMTNPTAGTTFTISSTTTSNKTLTLGSAGIDMSSATGNLTIDTPINLGAAQTWNIGAGQILEIGRDNGSNLLSGSSDLTVIGSGTLRLTSAVAALTYTFGTGTLRLGGGGGVLTLSQGGNGRTITNATVLDGDIKLVATASANINPFIFSGGLDIGSANRTITLSRPGNTTTPGTANNQILQINSANGISGSGTLNLTNASTTPSEGVTVLIASGGNVSVANLVIGNNVWLGFNAGSSADIGVNTALTVDAGGYLALVAPGGAQAGTRNIKSLSGAGTVTNRATNSTTSTLVIDGGTGTGRTNFSGVVNDISTCSLALTKTGSTTQALSGDNTYVGATAVNGGTLLVNGTHIQATAGGGYTVASGATLGGQGRIARNGTSGNAVSVAAGGTLAPGDGIGTLTLDGGSLSGSGAVLSMAIGAAFRFELAGNGTAADKVAFWNYVSGDFVRNNNAINLTLSGPIVAGTYTVTLFEFFTDDGTTLSTNTGVTSGLSIGSYDPNIFVGTPTLSYNNTLGTVTLQYAVIPEPTSLLFVAAGGCATLMFRRRRF